MRKFHLKIFVMISNNRLTTIIMDATTEMKIGCVTIYMHLVTVIGHVVMDEMKTIVDIQNDL